MANEFRHADSGTGLTAAADEAKGRHIANNVSDNDLLVYNSSQDCWIRATAATIADLLEGDIDHGTLTGKSDDDHTQYVLHTEVDDTPVNGATEAPISSNWAFDHVNDIHGSKARAYRSGTQTVSDSTWTKVQLNAESYDVSAEFDSTTNYRFVADATGYYLVTGNVYFGTAVDTKYYSVGLRKQGAEYSVCGFTAGAADAEIRHVSDVIPLAAAEYVELWCYHRHGGDLAIQGGETLTYMTVHRLS